MPAHHRLPAFRCRPGMDTVWAAVSLVFMWLCYFASTSLERAHPTLAILVLLGLGGLGVGTVLPALVATRVAGQGWTGLGFTSHRLLWALGLNLFFGLGSLPYFWQLAHSGGIDPAAPLVFSTLGLWEPLFVYGWLQLRFTRAFGWLPGIVLTTLSFAMYHLGSLPIASILGLMLVGLVLACLMAITSNIWTVFPILSGVSAAIGTVQSGLVIGWDAVAWGGGALVVQLAVLLFVMRATMCARWGIRAGMRTRERNV